jgi:TonB family protein
MMMRALAAALVASMALPAIGAARPFPAGRCSIADDGVATMPSKGPQDTLLQPLAMALPQQAPARRGLGGVLVIDLSFTVAANGSVRAPKVLCSSAGAADYVASLLRLVPDWRFAPLSVAGAVRASYRIVVSGPGRAQRIPLGYSMAI